MRILRFTFLSVLIIIKVSVGHAQIYGGGCTVTGNDTNYPEIEEFVTAGVNGGIPEITNIKATLNPGDNIQEAIDNGGAGVVYLNNGEYTVLETLYLHSNVILRGQSKEGVTLKSILYSKNAISTLVFRGDVSYAGIEDITIEYAGATDIEPIVRNSLTDGGWCSECFTNNPYGRDNLYVSLVDIMGDNNWVDNCNIVKAGTNPILVRSTANHNTIRGTLVDHSYNKGGGGNGYFAINGDNNLITGCTVRRIRHFAIQGGAKYNVVTNNHIEVDVNFHNGDAGYNLIEGNTLWRPSWHGWDIFATGGSTYGHQPPGPNNYLLNNTTWDYKNGTSSFSDPDVIYTFLTYGDPTPTTWDLPTSDGTFYPVSCTATNTTIPLTSIGTSSTLLLSPGMSVTLPVTYSPENASEKAVVWSSGNTSVATVNSSGVVTAIAEGTATITATASGHTATCTVTVDADATVGFTETFENMTSTGWTNETYVGDNGFVWTVNAKSAKGYINATKGIYMIAGRIGARSDLIPGGISSFSVTCKNLWSESVERTIELLINGKVVGSHSYLGTNIYTFAVDNINIAGDITIGVRNATPASGNLSLAIDNITWTPYQGPSIISVTDVTLLPVSLSLNVGETFTLNETVAPDNADDQSVTWSSSIPTVATVNSSGFLRAESSGTTIITVTTNDGGFEAECIVTVSDPQTNLADNKLADKIRVYPNPFNSVINISLNSNYDQVVLLDMMGRIVASQKVDGLNHFRMTPSYHEAPAGLYILKVIGDNYMKSFKLLRK